MASINIDKTINLDPQGNALRAWTQSEGKKYANISVIDDGYATIENAAQLFSQSPNLVNLNLSRFNLSNCNDISNLCMNCVNLQDVNLYNIDLSNTNRMTRMFNNCPNLITLSMSNLLPNLSGSMALTFYRCGNLRVLDTSGWDMTNVTNLAFTFNGCSNLEELDTSNWDTSNILNMYQTFSDCTNLKELDTSNWDTSKVTYWGYTFANCKNLNTIDLYNTRLNNSFGLFYNSIVNVVKLSGIYGYMNNPLFRNAKINTLVLHRLYIYNGWGTIDQNMFSNSEIHNLDLSGFVPTNQTHIIAAKNVENLIVNDISVYTNFSPRMSVNFSANANIFYNNWHIINMNTMSSIVEWSATNTTMYVSNWYYENTNTMNGTFYNSGWYIDLKDMHIENIENMDYCFSSSNLRAITGLNSLNTENVKSMAWMFYNCSNLIELNMDQLNTFNVQNISRMFTHINCNYIDISNIDTGNVKDASFAFAYTWNTIYDISRWNMASLVNGHAMFEYTNLYMIANMISNWNVSSLSNIDYMFYENIDYGKPNRYYNDLNLDLSKWNTSNLSTMYYAFNIPGNNVHINITGWDTSNLDDIGGLFAYYNYSSTNKIFTPDPETILNTFDLSNITKANYLFYNCDLSDMDFNFADTSLDINHIKVGNWFMLNTKFNHIDMNLDFTNSDGYISFRNVKVNGGNIKINNAHIPIDYSYEFFANMNYLNNYELTNCRFYTVYANRFNNFPRFTYLNCDYFNLSGTNYFSTYPNGTRISANVWGFMEGSRINVMNLSESQLCICGNNFMSNVQINTINFSKFTGSFSSLSNSYRGSIVNYVNISNTIQSSAFYSMISSLNPMYIDANDIKFTSAVLGRFLNTRAVSANMYNVDFEAVTSIVNSFYQAWNLIDFNTSDWVNMENITTVSNMFFMCNNLSDSSIQNIVNILLNCTGVVNKTLLTSDTNSPFYRTNIVNTRYENRWEELTAAGWTY